MTAAYPPEDHMLRDLGLTFVHGEAGGGNRAWMTIAPEVCNDAGIAHAGVLATLVDCIGGGTAAVAAHPDWIATADLTLHVVGDAPAGTRVEARAQVLRAGRTTVVLEVDLVDARDHELGIATMTFSVLPRRDDNPNVVALADTDEPTTMTAPGAGLTMPIATKLDARVVDAAAGALEVPLTDWSRNSMGAMQGGIVALVADVAAQHALQATIADLQIVYLGFGRVGPIRTRTEVLSPTAARVEVFDAGANERRMAIVSASSAK